MQLSTIFCQLFPEAAQAQLSPIFWQLFPEAAQAQLSPILWQLLPLPEAVQAQLSPIFWQPFPESSVYTDRTPANFLFRCWAPQVSGYACERQAFTTNFHKIWNPLTFFCPGGYLQSHWGTLGSPCGPRGSILERFGGIVAALGGFWGVFVRTLAHPWAPDCAPRRLRCAIEHTKLASK